MVSEMLARRPFGSRVMVWLAGLALFGLAACAATPTPYAPKTADTSTGYTDQQLDHNRFRVTFTGNSSTSRETVENYLLLRAAEVTLGAGYDYFLFDTRDTKANTTYRTSFSGWPGWHGYGWYWHSWAYDPFGPDPFGPGPFGMDTTSRPITRYHAYAEIVLLTADQAKDEPRAANAREIIAHLRPPPPPAASPPPPAAPSSGA